MQMLTFLGLVFVITVTSMNGLGWLLPQWGVDGYRRHGIVFSVAAILIALSYVVTFDRRN